MFRREKVFEISFQLHFFIRFQPTNTLLYMFIWLVKFRYALLPVVTSLEEKRFVKLVFLFNFVLVSNPRITCYIYSLGLLRFVSSCYMFRREKVLEISFQLHFFIRFQPTNTLLYMFIWLVKFRYALLPVVTSLEEKRFVKLVSRFAFVLVSNARLPCYICSLGLLLVFSSCYIFRREKVCQTSFQVHFCISFQPPNTLLHIFAGLVTRCYQLLYL